MNGGRRKIVLRQKFMKKKRKEKGWAILGPCQCHLDEQGKISELLSSFFCAKRSLYLLPTTQQPPIASRNHHLHHQAAHNNSQPTLNNDLLHQFLIVHHASSSVWHQRICSPVQCQHQDFFKGCWKLIHQSSWHWIRCNSRARFHHFQGEISRGSQDWNCRILRSFLSALGRW